MNVVPELVICREPPIVQKFDDFFIAFVKRDIALGVLHIGRMKMISDMMISKIEDLGIIAIDPVWKLPGDPESKVIEYRGVPVCYSPIRFGILRELILANGNPVSYETLCKAGWEGRRVDPEVIADAIYHLNRDLGSNGIPEFVCFETGPRHAFFSKRKSEKMRFCQKEERKKKEMNAMNGFFPMVPG